MKLSPDLNLIIRMNDEEGDPVIVHSTPLPTSVFEVNWKIFRDIYEELGPGRSIGSSLVSAKRVALEIAESYGPKKLNDIKDILQSIVSATFVISGGMPKLLAESNVSNDIKDEIVNRIIFFIVYYLSTPPSKRKIILQQVMDAIDAELSSQSAMVLTGLSTTSSVAEPIGNTSTSLPT